jgi:hypothetical protein
MSKAPRNSWSILPAGECLFDSPKVTLDQVMNFWNKGTVVVCKKANGGIGFIAGGSGNYAKIGDFHECHHDQTWRKMGEWEIIAQVKYQTVNGEIVMDVEGSIDGIKKASLHVFK